MMDATRQSWDKLQPLPDERIPLSLQRTFSVEEFEQMRRGFVPERMEDKWFIFCEENTLFFHRSWTGYCIFQLSLKPEETKYVVSELLVNRDEKQYSGTNPQYDVKLLSFLIDSLLLNQRTPLPLGPDTPAGIATELEVLHVIGAGQRPAEAGPQTVMVRTILVWCWHWLRWLIRL
jgi:hypothetical protein